VTPSPHVVSRLRSAGCVFAEDEAELLIGAARTPAELETMLDQRVGGRPLEHILGWAHFCGLRVAVEPGVFVPRRRTEFLARQAVALARSAALAGPGAVVVDLCCGSGAVGVVLTATAATIELYAVDIEPVAVRCARRNLAAVGGQVYEGDLYSPLPGTLRGRVELLVANAPYVPSAEVAFMPPEAREYEPRVALDGGVDGLDVLRRVIAEAPRWLAPGGSLLVETSARQADQAAGSVAAAGMLARVTSSEEFDATVVIASAVS